jgi:hypothetical protein
MHYVLILGEIATTLRRGLLRQWEHNPRTTLAAGTALTAVLAVIVWSTLSAILWPPQRHAWGSVQGRVTSVAGEPVAGVVVLFIDDSTGVGASGKTDSSGAYRAEGIKAGRYAVAVQPVVEVSDREISQEDVLAARTALEPRVPKRFQEVGSSGLTATMTGGRNRYDIDLRGPH